MKKILSALLLLAASLNVFAGSNSTPGLYYGQIPTAAQWNSYFATKLDYLPGALNTIPYWDASGNLLSAPVSGNCTQTAGVFSCTSAVATNLSGGATGFIPYQSAVNTTAFLTGNATTTPQFVTSTGNGSSALAPTLTTSTGTGSVVLSASPTFTSVPAAPTAAAATNTTQLATTAFVQQENSTRSRSDNPIINGEVLVDQANNGAVINVFGSTTVYSADMFAGFSTATTAGTAGAFSLQQKVDSPSGTLTGNNAPPTGFKAYLRATVLVQNASPAASDLGFIFTRIEGFNWARFSFGTANAKTITLPIYLRSSITGTFSGVLKTAAGTRSYPFTYVISAANTWTQPTITIAGDTSGTWPTDNSAAAEIDFDVGSGSNNAGTAGAWAGANYFYATGASKIIAGTAGTTLDITGMDAVEGSTTRPYPHLTYDRVKDQCSYYLPVLDAAGGVGDYLVGIASSTTGSLVQFQFPKKTRVMITGITGAGGGAVVPGNFNVRNTVSGAIGVATALTMTGAGQIGGQLAFTTTVGTPTLIAKDPIQIEMANTGAKLLFTGARL